MFTSGNGIKFFFRKLYAAGYDSRIFAKTRFAVIGQASAKRLLEFGIKADLCAAVESSKGLLEAFSKIDASGLLFLLPQAEVSSTELPDGLTSQGTEVDNLAVYKTVETEIDDVDLDYIDQILFTSGSTVRAFVNRFGSVPKHIEPLCLGVPTQTVAKEYNINAKILTQ